MNPSYEEQATNFRGTVDSRPRPRPVGPRVPRDTGRPGARRAGRADLLPGETGSLLDGHVALCIGLADGGEVRTELALPPGAPQRPLSDADLRAKAAACGPDVPELLDGLTWAGAGQVLRRYFPYSPHFTYEDQEA